MVKIEQILSRGPLDDNIESGLDQLRDSVLSNGIPSNADGMVRPSQAPDSEHH